MHRVVNVVEFIDAFRQKVESTVEDIFLDVKDRANHLIATRIYSRKRKISAIIASSLLVISGTVAVNAAIMGPGVLPGADIKILGITYPTKTGAVWMGGYQLSSSLGLASGDRGICVDPGANAPDTANAVHLVTAFGVVPVWPAVNNQNGWAASVPSASDQVAAAWIMAKFQANRITMPNDNERWAAMWLAIKTLQHTSFNGVPIDAFNLSGRTPAQYLPGLNAASAQNVISYAQTMVNDGRNHNTVANGTFTLNAVPGATTRAEVGQRGDIHFHLADAQGQPVSGVWMHMAMTGASLLSAAQVDEPTDANGNANYSYIVNGNVNMTVTTAWASLPAAYLASGPSVARPFIMSPNVAGLQQSTIIHHAVGVGDAFSFVPPTIPTTPNTTGTTRPPPTTATTRPTTATTATTIPVPTTATTIPVPTTATTVPSTNTTGTTVPPTNTTATTNGCGGCTVPSTATTTTTSPQPTTTSTTTPPITFPTTSTTER